MDDERLPPPPEYPSDPAAVEWTSTTPWAYAILAGAAMVAIGVFLPWVTLSFEGISVGMTGWDAKNYGTLILAGFGVYEGINAVRGAPRRGNPIITGVILGVFVALDWSDIQNARDEVEAVNPEATVSLGIGFFLVVIGAVLLVAGGIMDRRARV